MITADYMTIFQKIGNTNCHPLGKALLPHLLRYRPLAVKNYSFTTCALQMMQNHFVKYPG